MGRPVRTDRPACRIGPVSRDGPVSWDGSDRPGRPGLTD